MTLEIHLDERRHRRLEQRARCSGRGRCPEVDEDHVAAAEQLGVGTEHRVHARHVATGRAQRREAFAQWALERADIEHHALRR